MINILTSEYINHKVIISILTNSHCLHTSSDRIQKQILHRSPLWLLITTIIDDVKKAYKMITVKKYT